MVPKPLSQKTIEKKYSELGLPKVTIERLHTYFLCFANLYGVISLREAWEIFKKYEGLSVRKKDFVAFSGIVQREAGHPYSILELREVFGGEDSDDPQERLITNNKLILHYSNKYVYIYALNRRQAGKPIYLPDKQFFLSFTQDRFYMTPEGQRMKAFIEGLKTDGIFRNLSGEPNGKILDINGRPVAGKKLSDFIFYTDFEQFDIDYAKQESKKQNLRNMYAVTASEKLLNRIHRYIMIGGAWENSTPASEMRYFIESLSQSFGVQLTAKQFERFAELYINLNNKSNIWQNNGWRPDENFGKKYSNLPRAESKKDV